MKKRISLLLLTAAMLFALAACGGGGISDDERYRDNPDLVESTIAAMNVPISDELGFLTIQKSMFGAGETIVVTTDNITQEMYDDDAFVAIYNINAEHDEYGQYEYPQEGTDTLRFTAPYWAGTFELRLYSMDHVYTDDTFVTSLRFYVVIDEEINNVVDNGIAALLEPTSDELGHLTIPKSIFRINETIIVSTSGITQEMYDNNAFVAIYSSGAAHHEYRQYEYPQAGSDSLYFTAPFWTGAFEMRLYNMDHVYTDDTFVTSVRFIVIDDSYCPDCFELLENCICADDVNGGQGVTPPPGGTTTPPTDGTTPPPGGVTPPPNGVTPPPGGTPDSSEAAGFLGRFSFVEDGINHGAMFNLYFRADGTGIFNWLILPNTHIDWSVVGENRISISYQSISEYMTIYGTLDGDTLNVVDPYFPDNLYVFIRDE